MKILHLLGAAVAGGAELFTCNLCVEQARLGHKVSVVFLSSRTDSVGEKNRDDIQATGITTFTGPRLHPNLLSVKWVRDIIFRQRPDVVHLHTPNTELAYFLVKWLALPRRLLYRTIHNTNLSDSLLYKLLLQFNRAKSSIACGPAVYEASQQTLGDHLITVENGVKFSWPIRTPSIYASARRRLSLADGVHHFVAIGSMRGDKVSTAQKAHDVMIRAWKRLPQQSLRGAQLHLIGDGNLRPALERAADGDPSIVFHGIRPDVADWLQAADWFLMPSRYEGLPIAGIEAVGTGTPCIFSEISPLRNLDPANTLWCQADSDDALAACLAQACERPVQFADEAVAETQRTRFSIAKTAGIYSSLYQSGSSDRSPWTRRLLGEFRAKSVAALTS